MDFYIFKWNCKKYKNIEKVQTTDKKVEIILAINHEGYEFILQIDLKDSELNGIELILDLNDLKQDVSGLTQYLIGLTQDLIGFKLVNEMNQVNLK